VNSPTRLVLDHEEVGWAVIELQREAYPVEAGQ
jgi:hypothetical protein